ncbi:MAG: response regulator transcription factor [Actinomycetota bacterium]
MANVEGEADGPIGILVVDDHAISRSGVVQLCSLIPGAQVIGEASTGEDALELARLHAPEVVLMDVEMPGTMDGIEATRQIKAEQPNTAVIILTVHEDREVIFEAIKAGASGYLPKSAPLDRIQHAVKVVSQGGSFLEAGLARKVLDQFTRYAEEARAAADVYYLLTPREREVLIELSNGSSARQISSKLGISERTVNTHIGNTYRKLQVNNRVEAVHEAIRIRLIEPPR